LIDLSYKLKKLGAQKIISCTSHILSNEKSIQQLDRSEISMFITTDSIYNPSINLSSKIKVVSAVPLFSEVILRIHNNISISSLFNALPEKAIKISDRHNY
ncbi:MAG TPA: ribose-phosphate pyrophosphokinase, partial [Clostridia bacterium]|nr:ribose-phosphate pyrophosphokinase [Clostridia bacterium]